MEPNIQDIVAMADRVRSGWCLMGFAGKYEAEVMIGQTLQATKMNHEAGKGAFSYKDTGCHAVRNGGLADNAGGLSRLLGRGWIEESTTDMAPDHPHEFCKADDGQYVVLVPTSKLLADLGKFLDKEKGS